MTCHTDWKERCKERKLKQLESIPKEWIIAMPPDSQLNVMDVPRACRLLSTSELEITEAPINVLLANLSSGRWSCVQATTAFYKRAVVAQQLVNCLTEIFVGRAMQRARYLDDYLREHGKPMGPLHGLPISLKDQFSLKGLETIMGYAGWIGEYANENCVLAEILLECGANPFVRTNVPQTLIWGETYNHVFGRTTNPHNRQCTPGGSSGGEGALLALKGSPLGVGTDIGGSVRIPSAFCGLYALRPSYGRLPYQGARNSAEGQEAVTSVLGPMANSLEACKIFTKAVLDKRPWERDPMCLRKAWDQEAYELRDHGKGQNLCFAIMWDNLVVKPHPPVVRAMRMVNEALETAGHKIMDWKPYKHMELFHIVEYIWAADGAEDYQRHCDLSGEPLIQLEHFATAETQHLYAMETPPLNKIVAEGRGAQSAYQVWQLHKEKRKLRKEYLDHWNATMDETGTGRPVDCIISPTVPYGMTPHGLNTDAFYTTLWNVLDYPCVAFPVTTVDLKLDKSIERRSEFYNHEDEAIYKLYDSELFQDSPIGLQITCRTQEEEAVLALAKVVDEALEQQRIRKSGVL